MRDHYFIERRGGLAGLKASGHIEADAIDPDDRRLLEELLDGQEPVPGDAGADRYTYLVTRENAAGSTTREIPESVMPPTVANVVQAEI